MRKKLFIIITIAIVALALIITLCLMKKNHDSSESLATSQESESLSATLDSVGNTSKMPVESTKDEYDKGTSESLDEEQPGDLPSSDPVSKSDSVEETTSSKIHRDTDPEELIIDIDEPNESKSKEDDKRESSPLESRSTDPEPKESDTKRTAYTGDLSGPEDSNF